MQIWFHLSIIIIHQNKTLSLSQVQIFMEPYKCQENLVFFLPSNIIGFCSDSVKIKTFPNLVSKLLQCFISVYKLILLRAGSNHFSEGGRKGLSGKRK